MVLMVVTNDGSGQHPELLKNGAGRNKVSIIYNWKERGGIWL